MEKARARVGCLECVVGQKGWGKKSRRVGIEGGGEGNQGLCSHWCNNFYIESVAAGTALWPHNVKANTVKL